MNNGLEAVDAIDVGFNGVDDNAESEELVFNAPGVKEEEEIGVVFVCCCCSIKDLLAVVGVASFEVAFICLKAIFMELVLLSAES